MGKGLAIVGLLILAIYFFVFYSLVSAAIETAYKYDLSVTDVDITEPGFQNSNYLAGLESECVNGGGISPLGTTFCLYTEAIDQGTCEYVPGCSWAGDNETCIGIVDSNEWNPTGALNLNCDVGQNRTLCLLMGCSYVDYEPGSSFVKNVDNAKPSSFTKVIDIVSFMATFDANIGLGGFKYGWIFSFFLFWLPFLLTTLFIYMLTPFIH